MLYKPGLCLAVMLCLAVTASHAQSADSLAGRLADFPTRLFSRISQQSASLNQQISTQTQKYLARMAHREQRMQQRLAVVDSGEARMLFARSQQEYAALGARVRGDTGGRPVGLSGQYVPYADTLQGAMAFLQQHPELLAKGSGAGTASNVTSATGGVTSAANSVTSAADGVASWATSVASSATTVASSVESRVTSVSGTVVSPSVLTKLQGATGQFQALQAKMQDADIVKAYVQSRQQMISQWLAQHENMAGVLGKPLAGMQQEAYYYSQRVAQYKAMFSDPSALAQQALGMLAKLPAFQNFMANHSQLGSLFHLPGNYASPQAVNGLQTKAQIAEIVQSKVSAAGPGGAAALQANLQSAQSQLDSYKDKLSKLGIGNGDAQLPNFKPNDQKTKSFFGRLQYGFNFQTTHNSYYYPSLLSLGLSLGYKLGHSNIVGIGAAYQLGTGNGIQHIAFTSQGLGLRSFLNIKVKGSFSATGGLEYNYVTPFTTYQQLRQIQYWQKSGLIGVTKTISTKSKLLKQTTLSLLWDFLSYQNVPQTQAIIFRMGYAW